MLAGSTIHCKHIRRLIVQSIPSDEFFPARLGALFFTIRKPDVTASAFSAFWRPFRPH
ncbi:protein of unknown function (plasmid) [Cupriavidus neocaledonicus]|nr:protein of unknown function [Cupriavidus neocaledonicus]